MRLIVDLTDSLVSLVDPDRDTLPVSHLAAVTVDLRADSAKRPLVSGEILKLCLCAKDKFDGSPLASLELTIADLITGYTNVYAGTLDTLNTDVQTLLAINGDSADDEPTAACRIDAAILASGETDYAPVAESLTVTLTNNNFAEGADAPFPRPSGLFTPFAITALTGGTATTLDGVATVNLAVGTCIWLDLSGTISAYRLFSGTTAEASPGIIRPDDYNASTNAKVWKQFL